MQNTYKTPGGPVRAHPKTSSVNPILFFRGAESIGFSHTNHVGVNPKILGCLSVRLGRRLSSRISRSWEFFVFVCLPMGASGFLRHAHSWAEVILGAVRTESHTIVVCVNTESRQKLSSMRWAKIALSVDESFAKKRISVYMPLKHNGVPTKP